MSSTERGAPILRFVTQDSPERRPAAAIENLDRAVQARWKGSLPQVGQRGGISVIPAQVLRRLSEEVAVLSARRAVKTFVSRQPGVEDAVDFAYGFHLHDFDVRIQPSQIPSEIEGFLNRLRTAPPETIIEVGTATGGTLFLLASVAADDALLVSVDLPEGAFGGGYPRRRGKLYRAFGRDGQRIELLRRDSHEPKTVQHVQRLLRGRQVDLLFIDGDHTYDGVRQDYVSYSPLVRPGGLIAFHDIVPGVTEDVGGVPRFWQELKETELHEEIVESWDQGGFGIGIVTRPES